MRALLLSTVLAAVCFGPVSPSQDKRTTKREDPAEVARRIQKGQLALVRMHGKSLESPLWVRRCFGVQALGNVRHPAAMRRLVEALADKDPRVVAFVILELLTRADEVPPDAAKPLGEAVTRLTAGDPKPRMVQLALLAAERLPVAPAAYRKVWRRAFSKLRSVRTQPDMVTALGNVIRAKADASLVEHLVERSGGRTRSRQSKEGKFLSNLFQATPGPARTWSRWWPAVRSEYRFPAPSPTLFAEAVDAYIAPRRLDVGPEHGTREYFQQFEVYLGKLYTKGLDVVFVFDSTGSMQPLIDQVKENVRVMAELLTSITQETRVGLLTYRDVSDAKSSYVTRHLLLTDEVESLERWMKRIRAGGGGDSPEAVLQGLEKTLEAHPWRRNAKRVVTIIGDAPPHAQDRPALRQLCEKAARNGFVVNTVALTHAGAARAGRRPPATTEGMSDRELLGVATSITFADIARWGGGQAVVQDDIARVIADLLRTAFGAEWKDEVEQFVEAYLLFAISESSLRAAHRKARGKPNRFRRRLLGEP